MSRAWAVYDGEGSLREVGTTAAEAQWRGSLLFDRMWWHELEAAGWRCVQVEVTPVKEKVDD